jgi:hypothetical protein
MNAERLKLGFVADAMAFRHFFHKCVPSGPRHKYASKGPMVIQESPCVFLREAAADLVSAVLTFAGRTRDPRARQASRSAC